MAMSRAEGKTEVGKDEGEVLEQGRDDARPCPGLVPGAVDQHEVGPLAPGKIRQPPCGGVDPVPLQPGLAEGESAEKAVQGQRAHEEEPGGTDEGGEDHDDRDREELQYTSRVSDHRPSRRCARLSPLFGRSAHSMPSRGGVAFGGSCRMM